MRGIGVSGYRGIGVSGYRGIGKILCLMFLAAPLAGCGDSATSKLVSELKTGYAYSGKRVELTGYLRPNRGVTSIRDGKVNLMLVSSAMSNSDKADALVENVMVNFGKEPNSFYAPDKFKGNEIEFRDASGNQYDVNTEFKISGVVQYDSTAPITEPKPPSGPFIAPMLQQSYEKKLADYNERKKSGNLYDYAYKIVDVTLEKK